MARDHTTILRCDGCRNAATWTRLEICPRGGALPNRDLSTQGRMTPRTDAWKARLSAAVAGRGIKAELARYLCEGEHQLASRKVQIAKVLNQGAMPEPEFVLATLEWMDVEQRTL